MNPLVLRLLKTNTYYPAAFNKIELEITVVELQPQTLAPSVILFGWLDDLKSQLACQCSSINHTYPRMLSRCFVNQITMYVKGYSC